MARKDHRGRTAAATLGALAVLLAASAAAFLAPALPARAETGGYPAATMPCEWAPQATSGPPGTEWCNDFDWGPAPSTVSGGQESVDESATISPRGFGYRNCTDYVAWLLGFGAATVHGNAAQWRSQVPSPDVTRSPTVGAVAWWGSEVDQGFGHVGVVLSVEANGEAVVGEYNAHLDGTYDTREVSPRAVDAFLHIRDQGAAGGVPFHPPAPPPPPRPSPSPGPKPAPSSPPPPSPSPTPPPGPNPEAVAQALGRTAGSFVSLEAPRALRPGGSDLVSARIAQTVALASALRAGPPAAALPAGSTLVATLEARGFAVRPTTPGTQAIGADAVWQWQVHPTGHGPHALTLCLSVALPAGETPPACTVSRRVRVSALGSFPVWLVVLLLAAILLVAAGLGGVAVRLGRSRSAAARHRL